MVRHNGRVCLSLCTNSYSIFAQNRTRIRFCGLLVALRLVDLSSLGKDSVFLKDPDGSLHRVLEGFGCPNGMNFSLDNKTL